MRNAVPWTVHLDPTAEKHLDRLPPHDRDAVRDALRVLARDPLAHPNAERLRHQPFGWKLRVRDYRVLYDLDPVDRAIVVGA
jgi:mRNA-degrading endonuclease RelE of RelBE toxin-antitoxin system